MLPTFLANQYFDISRSTFFSDEASEWLSDGKGTNGTLLVSFDVSFSTKGAVRRSNFLLCSKLRAPRLMDRVFVDIRQEVLDLRRRKDR